MRREELGSSGSGVNSAHTTVEKEWTLMKLAWLKSLTSELCQYIKNLMLEHSCAWVDS